MNVRVEHPTDRLNFYIVVMGRREVAFSYRTPIAFRGETGSWVVSENLWGPTTGKHLNYFCDKTERVSRERFENLYNQEFGEVYA